MLLCCFTVPGTPIGQPRHKAGRINRGRRAGQPIHYLPEDHPVHNYKEAIQLAAVAWRNGLLPAGARCYPLRDPVQLETLFVMPRPKSLPRQGPAEWAAIIPDLDNLDKAVRDALKGILWVDDRQIVLAMSAKVYAPAGGKPYTRIQLHRPPATPVDTGPDLRSR